MATFRVGQRVRIKYSNGWPELAGKTGRIVGKSSNKGILGDSEWEVAPDEWGSCIAPRPGVHWGEYFCPNSCQLEPILYDGNKTAEWGECLWMPGHMKEVT